MYLLANKFRNSPIAVRFVPFAVFLVLTFGAGIGGEQSPYWFYLIKSLVGAWLIWEMRPFVEEMRWVLSWEAVVVGVAVCAMWIGIDNFYPKMGSGKPQNPNLVFGQGSSMAWFFVVVHILGSTFVVPPLEEVFYRSFLYRYLIRMDFLTMPLGRMNPLSFVVTSALFGFEHYQWLAGILCGLAYQWLVIRKNRLGDAITAHAITNFLLGLWIVCRNDWKFW
jgi:CAAX prenyl protease-like protein